jgi:resuscitation-promoting factor RpfB
MQRKLKLFKRRQIRRLKIFSRHPVAVPVVTFLCLVLIGAIGLVLLQRHSQRTDAMVVIISHDHVEQTVPSSEHTVGSLIKKLNIVVNTGDVVEPALDTPINQDYFRINIYRAVPVVIYDEGHKTTSFSAASTPRSIAKQKGLTVYAEDKVQLDPVEDFLREGVIGQKVVIERATPVNLNLYGSALPIRTQAKTVGQLIKEKHIRIAKDDQVTPNPSTPISTGQQIFITRNGTKIESVTQKIAMPVQTIQDKSLAYGTSAVRQTGSPGEQVVTYQINLQNGKEVSRTVIQSLVTVQPVVQIVAKGINLGGIKGDMALAGISSSDYSYVDYIVSKESGWNPHAYNASSGAYGLCQALPGSKMATAGSDWHDNPVTQLRWCDGYAKGRYGSWRAAYNYWISHHYW